MAVESSATQQPIYATVTPRSHRKSSSSHSDADTIIHKPKRKPQHPLYGVNLEPSVASANEGKNDARENDAYISG